MKSTDQADWLDEGVLATDAQRSCFAAIAAMLMAAGYAPRRSAVHLPILTRALAETTVTIEVQPLAATETWVGVYAYGVMGCLLAADLLLFCFFDCGKILRRALGCLRSPGRGCSGHGDILLPTKLLDTGTAMEWHLAVDPV
ncbi:MAG: hypothetical protein ACUVSQ_00170, partial [Pseudanabaenaceae cyanobacterium]